MGAYRFSVRPFLSILFTFFVSPPLWVVTLSLVSTVRVALSNWQYSVEILTRALQKKKSYILSTTRWPTTRTNMNNTSWPPLRSVCNYLHALKTISVCLLPNGQEWHQRFPILVLVYNQQTWRRRRFSNILFDDSIYYL